MRTGLPRRRDPRGRGRRALLIAGVCSVLLHVLLAALVLLGGIWSQPRQAKKGEPLFVDIAPDKPQEKAPAGNPSRPPGAPARPPSPPPAPKAAEAKVRVAEAPRPAPTPPAPTAPAPPTPKAPEQVAKAAPEPPAPKAPPEPAPAPKPAETSPTPPTPQAAPAPREPHGPAENRVASPPAPQGPMTARSSGGIDLPAAMLRRPPGQGGGGLQDGRGGVEGEPVPLDTPDPKYQDYFRILRERIQAKWTYPREAGDRGIGGALLIEFHIAKDGRLAYLEIRRSSGVEILDEYAVNAIKLAQPFPPVPDNLAKQVLAINGNFVYQIVENSLVKQFTR
jgi:periplasmic protein TonB